MVEKKEKYVYLWLSPSTQIPQTNKSPKDGAYISQFLRISNQNAWDSDLVHVVNIGRTKLRTEGQVFVIGNSQNHLWAFNIYTFQANT